MDRMATTAPPTRRRSSLLKWLQQPGAPRRQGSITASIGTAASSGEADGNHQKQQQQPQDHATVDPAARKTHEQLAQYRAGFLQRMQASLEEATAIGGRADVLVAHQRVQVCTMDHAVRSIESLFM